MHLILLSLLTACFIPVPTDTCADDALDALTRCYDTCSGTYTDCLDACPDEACMVGCDERETRCGDRCDDGYDEDVAACD